MAFYKLFYIVHRRTDWVRLYRWQRETIMPEWYEERERQFQQRLASLVLATGNICEVLSGRF